MKKSLAILCLSCLASFGATGDTTISINADGWSGYLWVAGGNTNGTWASGLAANNRVSGAEKLKITLNAPGYDATGATGIVKVVVYGTTMVRLAYTSTGQDAFPNVDIAASPGFARVRFALSDFIYAADTTLTAELASGCYTSSAGANNAASGLTVTNNSTQAYPLALGQWDHVAGVATYDRVKNDFTCAMNARHAYGVAAVRFDATGRTSSANVNGTVSSQTATKRTGTGLFASAYQKTLAIAGFTQGERIDLRARVYPRRGDPASILDTDLYTTNSTTECLGLNKATILCDKNNSLDVIKYVATTGNDTTGTGSSGAPYATIGKAIANGNVIYLKAGTHAAVGVTPGTRVTGNEWRVVQPEPGQSSATVTVRATATTAYACERLMYSGVTFTLLNTSSWMDGQAEGDSLRFQSCVFTTGGVGAPTTGLGYRSDTAYYENCTGDLGMASWDFADFSARLAYQFDGCTFTKTASSTKAINPWFRVVACTGQTASGQGDMSFNEHSTSSLSPPQDNVFFDNNVFLYTGNSASAFVTMAKDVAILRGASFSGNVIECVANNQPLLWIGADSSTVRADNYIVWDNTLAGNRWNCGYNDSGTTALSRNYWSVRNNILESLATKHDTFGTRSANRIGGWPVLYGVGWSGNFSPHITGIGASGSFAFDFIGLNSYQPTYAYSVGNPPTCGTSATGYAQFVNRQAYTGSSGTGNGNYRITTPSPATQLPAFVREAVLTLEGQNIGLIDSPGAYAMASPRRGF